MSVEHPGLMGIEVAASGLKVLLAGFDLFPSLVQRLIVSKGILKPGPGGKLEIREDRWFPLESWLSVLEAIHTEIGPNAAFKLGRSILANPKFPPWIRDIETALESIDVAYHRSHRKAGVIMYDAQSGRMLEGIGHYRPHRLPGQQKIRVDCDTPYPCEIDFGIVTELATKFEGKARAVHDPGACRRKGSDHCTYIVTW
ncbi:MAG: hypothetical protein QM820_55025 [Minicystis sp.]